MANLVQRLRNFIARRRSNNQDSENLSELKSNRKLKKFANRGGLRRATNGTPKETVTSNGGTRGSTVINGEESHGTAVLQEPSAGLTTGSSAENTKEKSTANGTTTNGTVKQENGTTQALEKSSNMDKVKNVTKQARESVEGAVNAVTAGVAGTSISDATAASSSGGSDAKLLKDEETGEMVSKSERM
jgi:hypothetical protein